MRVAALLLFALTFSAFAAPAEPPSYRLDDYQAPVPATLNGQPALDVARAKALWEGGALFLDVLPHAPRPKGLAPEILFVDKPHVSIKGAIWLPEVGRGELSAQTDTYFRQSLSALTAGDVSRKIVVFCKRDCWMSWNAARRAQAYGYRNILWFSEGVEGWRDAGLPMETIKPYGS
ncbi:PQQ-dependent catabolism-associated CXXCW motif protein [Rhodoblastus acidophilus]|uniref:PQQ-dependent catabolism-associated CXXCW motif protein n=1 Tax=Rhodoblastus acidophilus TaxID=1074 RepID=UPI0022242526|nr:PQQ-dependent catabolism-associated CXXCW motif protein [Rhodoblastus acidophilus]MCW2283609.1 PQQ-dependent catabolism-associated CXXCW motif protein [Rhodoblastus acidophilus]MCW2332469.1 PQQ-dependent catabolism-associated CXXCW motif protein [Rhodoblastus acidophilus]